MSSPPHLRLPDGLELRPAAAPAMPTATLPHSATKSRLSLQTSQPATRQPISAPPKTRQPLAAQPVTKQQVAARPATVQPAVTSQATVVQTARQPVQPAVTSQATVVQTARQPVQPTRQLTAVFPTRQTTAAQPTARQPLAAQPATTQGVTFSGRRENEPVPKKRRLLEATEASSDGHEMTKTVSGKQGDAEDILAKVCLAVGIDSDLVESVVEDPPPAGHHPPSAVVGSAVPGHLQYLRGVRPLHHPGISPPAHRLRRPELRFHSSMHPAYRVPPDGSYALAEVRHPYYFYRPPDPAYMVQNHMGVHPGEPHHYRPLPQYVSRYRCMAPVSQPMNRPPMLRPGPPIGPSDRRLPVPHSSPTLPHQSGEIRHYAGPPPPGALHHDPRRGPPVVHHIHHKVPGMKHVPPGHPEIPYGIPTSRHDSSSATVPENPAAATSRTGSQRTPTRPGLQECGDQQKQHAGLREVYIPATSVGAHHPPPPPQASPYSMHPYQGNPYLYPRTSEAYSKLPYSPRAEPVRDAVRQDATTPSRAPIIPLQPSPDKRLQTVRPSYIPEQVPSRDQTWGAKRLSDDSDRPPEVVQIRRTMEPPKPCVELIPIGPPRNARERKSVGEDSHKSSNVSQKQFVAAPDRRQQGVKTSSSQHAQLFERTRIDADQKVLIATYGHAIHRQTPAAGFVAQPASFPDNHQGRLPMTSSANPELMLLTRDHRPGVFRRPLSSDPSSSRGETFATEEQKAHRYNRCNSDPTNTHSRTFDDKCETNEKGTDSRCSTHGRISSVDDIENDATSPQTRSEERASHTELDHTKTQEERTFTSDGDTTVERADNSKNHNDLKHDAQQREISQETHQRIDGEKTETEFRSVGQDHVLHSNVHNRRPASEPPLGLIQATSEAVSSRKRPASLPSADQHSPTNMRYQNDLIKRTSRHQESTTISEDPSETDKVFMERLKLVLNDLLSVPEATNLQRVSCSTEQLLASVVKRGGATPSKEPSPRKRLREDFKTVVKLCLPATLLKYWGWDLCTPDQILDQLIKVTQNGDEGANGSVRSTPSSPPTRDDILEDDVFSPPPCSASRPFIPAPYPKPVLEPHNDHISHAPHTHTAQPCAYTSTTYTKHHHIPVSYVPSASVMPSHSPHGIPACTNLNSNVETHSLSDPNSAQMYATGGEEGPFSKPGKNTNPPPPTHHAQHTAAKWPGGNSGVVSPVYTPVNAKAPAT